MQEKQWILLDKLKRKFFIKYEIKKIILLSIKNNNNIPNYYKYYALYKKNKIIRWSNISQQTNRCIISGRGWSVNKISRYSRFIFRKESYCGNIPGFKKASW